MRHSFAAAFRLSIVWAALAVLMAPGAARAATTGGSELLTPQGDTAGTANGDFISDQGGLGLDAPYRFWIEVTPGLSRLVVDLFDADVGAGGAGEDDAGRDRNRGSATYETTATYELFDPSGTARTTRFTTGSNGAPTGADNAWLTLYDGTGKDVRDNFGTGAYTNNDGTDNWAGAWAETDGGGGGATGGAIQIVGGELRIQDNVAGTPSIQRQADLSASGLDLAVAYLSFDYRTSNNLEDADQISVQVRNCCGGWTNLETFSNDSSGSRTYDITPFIANDTEVRFVIAGGYGGGESFFVDNLQIHDGGALTAGHWELRVTMNDGNDINALGIRAHDGTSGSGGTEVNVYADSFYPLGVNPNPGSNSRTYHHYPYMTSGCTAGRNDFDYDSNSGDVGSMTYDSRTGSFTQTFASGTLATDDEWNRDNLVGWPSDTNSTDYGIWSVTEVINTYTTPAVNGNYTVIYMSTSAAAANPPTANPMANVIRTYFGTDAGAAPVKPYLEQLLRFSGCGISSGPNPPVVGQTSCFTTTVRLVNPTAHDITFSSPSNLVTANVPGGAAVYGGGSQVSQGSITSEPAVGGSGNIVWNPGTVAAGDTALMSYRLDATPTSGGQRILMTGSGTGSGTRATYVDETGNTSQARATYSQGPLCELAVTEGLLTPAVVSGFRALPGERGGVVVEWTTASEPGTSGFRLFRRDATSKRWVPLHRGLLAGLQGAPQGGTYRFLDEGAQLGESLVYRLEEVESSGSTRSFGPYRVTVDRDTREAPPAMTASFERAAHEGPRAPQSAQERVASAAAKVAGVVGGAKHGAWLGVDETGLYSVTVPQLMSWFGKPVGEIRSAIASGKLQLSRGGKTPVAWYPDYPTPSGGRVVINPGMARGIYFYGVATPSTYSQLTAYRIELDVDGDRMSAASVGGAAVKPATAFGDRRRSEQDLFAATVLPLDPASDYWFWDYLMAGDPGAGQRSFAVEAPSAQAGAPATLYLDLQGATSGTFGSHDVAVTLNGTALAPDGNTAWSDLAALRVAFPVPSGVLLASGNQLTVAATGAAGNIFYVDGFDLEYSRPFTAVDDSLAFVVWPIAGGAEVGGFSGDGIRLLDVASPEQPRWLNGATVARSKTGGFTLAFGPVTMGPFLAVGPAAVRQAVGVRAWSGESGPSEADLLIVAPVAWKASAERLADLRRGEGLVVRVVTTDEIADNFGEGIATPEALHAMIATERQGNAHLRYVLLAGDGTVDYRNLLGFDENAVPALFVSTPQGLFPADGRYGDLDGDGFPDIAVGRLPVRTLAELDAVVDKLVAYDGVADTSWVHRALLLADAPDGGANFAADSEAAAAFFRPPIEVQRIYLADSTLAAVRIDLADALVSGVGLVNYFGHGGLDRLTAGGMLTSADVPSLDNGARLPLFTAMTCSLNRFAVAGVPSLGELLVRSATGGTSAVLAASGTPASADSRALALRLYGQPDLLIDPQARLGDWMLGGFQRARADVANPQIFDLYNLLGDPSMKLRLGPETAPSAPSSGGE